MPIYLNTRALKFRGSVMKCVSLLEYGWHHGQGLPMLQHRSDRPRICHPTGSYRVFHKISKSYTVLAHFPAKSNSNYSRKLQLVSGEQVAWHGCWRQLSWRLSSTMKMVRIFSNLFDTEFVQRGSDLSVSESE